MKVWSPIFNIFAVLILLVYMNICYTLADSYQRDFDTNRLSIVLDYATEAAFLETTEEGDISIDYDNLYTVTLNPANSLEVLESIICLNYGMSTSKENLSHVEYFIPTAVIACNDGYYITKASEVQGVGGTEWKFTWSLKHPYVLEVKDQITEEIRGVYSVHMNDRGGILLKNNGEITYFTDYVNNDDLRTYPISDSAIKRAVNSTLTDAITYNLSTMMADRGGVNYKFYLPAEQTSRGINDVKYPSFILLMNGADFAGKAHISNAILGGYRTVKNVKVIGYKRMIAGEERMLYCYESQLPEEYQGDIINYFHRVEDAAKAGFSPDYEFIFDKIDTNFNDLTGSVGGI